MFNISLCIHNPLAWYEKFIVIINDKAKLLREYFIREIGDHLIVNDCNEKVIVNVNNIVKVVKLPKSRLKTYNVQILMEGWGSGCVLHLSEFRTRKERNVEYKRIKKIWKLYKK
jgi:hypothetical protein